MATVKTMDEISTVFMSKNIAVNAGQSIQIQVLNADGSVSATVCNDACPAGMSLSAMVSYSGTLS